MKHLAIICALFFITPSFICAQQIKAVIVHLASQQNKIRYFQKAGMDEDVKRMTMEAAKVRKLMISDFTDNFSYCPVYYYIDTNIELVKQKKFDGILLNADGTPAKKNAISSADTNYLVVYYGDPEESAIPATEVKGLVVCNDKLEQIFYLGGHWSMDPKYYFKSRKYDVVYMAVAKELNLRLHKKYDDE